MKYCFFLDETGDHGLSSIDKNFPLFLLCGCIIKEDKLNILKKDINDFKHRYFKTETVILHSREIRKCEGAFQILFNLDIKAKFYADLNQILAQAEYTVIGSGINKENYIKKYGKDAKDPYSISLSFVVERMIFCLDKVDKDAQIEIIVEKRGKNEDRMLASHFNSIIDRGTFYVTRERMHSKITSFGFLDKKDNSIGLQLADLIAYPLARRLINPSEPYIPFEVVKDKIYCNDSGEYEGWGLKLFP
ncbi:MAG: DUF3800 domain-containing protein [Candidatus Firestonebacteria bacterium]